MMTAVKVTSFNSFEINC